MRKVAQEMVAYASKHMYNVLTTNYSALFRPSSPFYIDWHKDGNFDLIGRDEALRTAFDNLRAQIHLFCELISYALRCPANANN